MTERLTRHDEFMQVMQSCINGELILTADEVMDYADECDELSRREDIERLNAYMTYALVKAEQANNRGVKIA